jgi:large subunit ribosomal protein L9
VVKIILKKDFKQLGYKNDLVSVRPGYARNYLIPQGFAAIATPQGIKMAQENAKQMAHKLTKHKQEAENMAHKIRETTLQIKAKVGEKNKIFGSITPLQIVEALKEKTGYLADRRDVSFEKSAKTLGLHKAIIKLHKEVMVPLQYEVVADS